MIVNRATLLNAAPIIAMVPDKRKSHGVSYGLSEAKSLQFQRDNCIIGRPAEVSHHLGRSNQNASCGDVVMAEKALPSIEELRQLLRCDPDAGKLFWLPRPDNVQWSGKWSGCEAFTTIGKNGYHFGRIHRRGFYAHRVIWTMCHGEWPNGQIDHINGSRTDNRIVNLRVCTQSENSKNACVPSHNTSGHMGVSFIKATGRWEAHIGMPNARKKMTIGFFDSVDQAVSARKAAEKALGYHPNHGRSRA